MPYTLRLLLAIAAARASGHQHWAAALTLELKRELASK